MNCIRAWFAAPYLDLGIVAFYSSRWSGDFRRSIWIRRPDTGWWVFWIEGGVDYLALKGRWEWLP